MTSLFPEESRNYSQLELLSINKRSVPLSRSTQVPFVFHFKKAKIRKPEDKTYQLFSLYHWRNKSVRKTRVAKRCSK